MLIMERLTWRLGMVLGRLISRTALRDTKAKTTGTERHPGHHRSDELGERPRRNWSGAEKSTWICLSVRYRSFWPREPARRSNPDLTRASCLDAKGRAFHQAINEIAKGSLVLCITHIDELKEHFLAAHCQ